MDRPQRALVVAAHPDDCEFGCGGTIAKWAQEGSDVLLVVATNGDKGNDNGKHTPEDLAKIRNKEQHSAAKLLGVKEVQFLPFADGSLLSGAELRGHVVRYIRKFKPDVVLTHDPTVLLHDFGGVNHSDHRNIGEATIDAVYPFSRGVHQYPEHAKEGLNPHTVRRLLLWSTNSPNFYVDICDTADVKLEALFKHASQYPDPEGMKEFTQDVMERAGRALSIRYAEAFRRIDC
jgi:LmbE family N-acetylglucosaminyl deacetylase